MLNQQETVMNKQKRFKLQGPCAYEFDAGNTGSWRIERPQVDFEICVKCGTCATYCPANVMTIEKDKEVCVEIMWDYCKGCGICANECPKQCITMVEERCGK